MARCQHCTEPGRKRLYQGVNVWLCRKHWQDLKKGS